MKNFAEKTDHELIQQFIAGDSDSLKAIVLRHKDKLFTSIVFLVKDKFLAEDIFQDTFIRIIETLKAGRYNDEGKFLPWSMRIAHNLCVDHFRKVKRTPLIKQNDEKDIMGIFPFPDDNAEIKIIKKQSHERVHEMLDRLPDDQREVIILRHFGDLSFKQIADLTNCSINTALGRMRYGLINLRRMMLEKHINL
ncbi:MAG: sigma-70 family RNA polymerase sigma factor [Chitinophagaceae bacterium]|nr:MAG: sigma-70 family RNA polymerase sigma factor [Chitinophagaceae bacterium]